MELTEEEIKQLLKEQREICANKIKDMNFTLAEIVRIAPAPIVSRVELPVSTKVLTKEEQNNYENAMHNLMVKGNND